MNTQNIIIVGIISSLLTGCFGEFPESPDHLDVLITPEATVADGNNDWDNDGAGGMGGMGGQGGNVMDAAGGGIVDQDFGSDSEPPDADRIDMIQMADAVADAEPSDLTLQDANVDSTPADMNMPADTDPPMLDMTADNDDSNVVDAWPDAGDANPDAGVDASLDMFAFDMDVPPPLDMSVDATADAELDSLTPDILMLTDLGLPEDSSVPVDVFVSPPDAGCEPEPEICDSMDNDCDGQVDENLRLGEVCTVGLGFCQATGILTCLDAQVDCSVRPGNPIPEICNGIDDNCDDQVDEGVKNSCGRCGPVPSELCNGQDDNCNGEADEDYPVSTPCAVGRGVCRATGLTICAGDSLGVVCNTTPGAPDTEICDGFDNDCDGGVDEELGGQSVECGVGECTRTLSACDGGEPPVCDPLEGAQAERCDDLDNDCDGQTDEDVLNACGVCGPVATETCNFMDDNCDGTIDEGFNLGSACTTGTGQCRRQGQIVCAADGTSECTAVAGQPQIEICDNLDNNCDDTVDDGFNLGTACQLGVGACARQGTITCSPEGMSACNTAPGNPIPEICDGLDNNCDGTIDEIDPRFCFGGKLGEINIGVCHAGIETCRAGAWSVCVGEVLPSPEICDDLDNDCDGVNNNLPGMGNPCQVGMGVCRRQGVFNDCDPDEGTLLCSVSPGLPVAEICNGLDDNCNGQTDDGLGGQAVECGLGECFHSVTGCSGGEPPICDPFEGAEPERCDGLDNDCDSSIDENFSLGTGCIVGQGACTRQGLLQCDAGGGVECSVSPGDPAAETCNTIDDNCNGTTDEGVLNACGGCGAVPSEVCDGLDNDCDNLTDESFNVGDACNAGAGECLRNGVITCLPEGSAACNAQAGQPTIEVCDTMDNDCDGVIDDNIATVGFPCTEGVGACQANGVTVCNPPQGVVCNAVPGQPVAEICNAIDDNCNGTTDEGVLNACGGCGAVPSEVCDGLDNDCDGLTDEDELSRADDLVRLSCWSAYVHDEITGLWWDRTERMRAFQATAQQNCQARGGRLPTVTELRKVFTVGCAKTQPGGMCQLDDSADPADDILAQCECGLMGGGTICYWVSNDIWGGPPCNYEWSSACNGANGCVAIHTAWARIHFELSNTEYPYHCVFAARP